MSSLGPPKVSLFPRLLSVAMVATHLGVSTKTVRRLIKDGLLPSHRVGRQTRVSETDLAVFIAQLRSA
jgi:excisionase family DNA binding protein